MQNNIAKYKIVICVITWIIAVGYLGLEYYGGAPLLAIEYVLSEVIFRYSLFLFLPLVLDFSLEEYELSLIEKRQFRIKKTIYIGLIVSIINAGGIIGYAFYCSEQFCVFGAFLFPISIIVGVIISFFIGKLFFSMTKRKLNNQ